MTDDEAIMARFVHDYLELLDHRVESIQHHLDARNFMTAHVALLSLESTSVMVGANELAEVAGRLRSAVEQGQRNLMPELLTQVLVEAVRVRARLSSPS